MVQPGGPNIDGVAIVASGRYEIGQVSSSPSLMLAASQEIPVKCFAAGAQEHPYTFFSLTKKPIREPKDLVGKKVGIQATAKVLLRALLKNTHPREGRRDRHHRRGHDAAADRPGRRRHRLADQHHALKVLGARARRPAAVGHRREALRAALLRHRETLEKKPEMLAKFLRAAGAGWDYACKNREKAVDFLVKEFPNLKRDDELERRKVLLNFAFNANTKANGWGTMDPAVWQEQINLYDELKQFSARAQARRGDDPRHPRRHQGRARQDRLSHGDGCRSRPR